MKSLQEFKQKLNKHVTNVIRHEIDELVNRLREACPAPSLKDAFMRAEFTDGTKRVFQIRPKPGEGRPRGRREDISTMRKLLYLEYGRPGLPGGKRYPLHYPKTIRFPVRKRKIGGKEISIQEAISPRAKEKMSETPPVIIRYGPIKAVPPTHFMRNTIDKFKPELKQRVIDAVKEVIEEVRQ